MKLLDTLYASLVDLGCSAIEFSFIAREFGIGVQGFELANFRSLGEEDWNKIGTILVDMRRLAKMKDNIAWAEPTKVLQAVMFLRLKKATDGADDVINSALDKCVESLPVNTPGAPMERPIGW